MVGHVLHCFARRGDVGELPEGTLELSNIRKYLVNNFAPWQGGHGDYAQVGVECDIFTDEEMKTQSFVDELNILKTADAEGVITESAQSVWKMDTEGINGGYPIFTWQTKGKTKY